MKNNLVCKFAKLVMVPALAFGFSINSFAAGHSDLIPSVNNSSPVKASKLSQILASPLHKSQFAFIANKLVEKHLPKELALIPVIESEYNSHAVSPKGAGGLWQLMPATAKGFGISSKDRFQLEPSTLAALTYFSELHEKFGNWEFAIAAYNAGDGRVQKALKKNPSATCVQDLNLPKETKQYVTKFYQMQNELKTYTA